MDNAGNGITTLKLLELGQASDGTTHKDANGSGVVRHLEPQHVVEHSFLFWGHDGTALLSSTFTVGLAGGGWDDYSGKTEKNISGSAKI